MGSERARWILLAAVLLGGCRADVIVPDDAATAPVPEGYLAYEPWTPAIRVIGTDGVEVPWTSAFLSNFDYYASNDSLDRARRGDRFFDRDRIDEVEPLVPPFVAEVQLDLRRGEEVVLVDVAPAAGETLVVDLREGTPRTFGIDVRGDDPPDVLDMDVWTIHRASIPRTDGSTFDRIFRMDWRDVPTGGDVEWTSLPGFVGFHHIELEWNVRKGPVEGFDTLLLPAEALASEAVPTHLDLVVDAGPVFVEMLRAGRPVRDQRLQIVADSRAADGSSLRSLRQSDRAPVDGFALRALDSVVDLRIVPLEAVSWMLPRNLEVAAATGDTVRVELGRFDLDVEVVDAVGEPLPGAWIRVHRPGQGGWGQGVTGPAGVARFAVDPGVVDVEVRLNQYAGDQRVERRIRVTDDALVRVELR